MRRRTRATRADRETPEEADPSADPIPDPIPNPIPNPIPDWGGTGTNAFQRARSVYLSLCEVDERQRLDVLRRLDRDEPELTHAVRLMLETDSDDEQSRFATPLMRVDALVDEALALEGATVAQVERNIAIDFGPRYRPLSYIGRGGAGEVYRAEQLHPLQREVALKLFPWSHPSPKERRRFEREAIALARLTHAGIAQVIEACTTPDGRLFLAMEYVPGTPIDQACDDLALSPTQRIRLLTQVCEAVEHAHQRGVIHRDLKPNNILVTGTSAQPAAKVIDFGVARLLDNDSAVGQTLTQVGEIVGTPQYMSPEQRAGGGVDRRSDVYALGRLLDALVPSNHAGHGEDASRTGTLLETSIALPKRQLADLAATVRTATAHEPDDRYSTPIALAEDLQRILDDRPVRARRVSRLARLGRLCRRQPATATLCLLIAIALALLGGSLIQSQTALTSSRDHLSVELKQQRTLTVALLDEVLDQLYAISGAGQARRKLTSSLFDRTVALLEISPNDVQLRHAYARLLVELGKQHLEDSRGAEALALHADAAMIFEDLATMRPDDLQVQRRHAEAIVRVGDSILFMGDLTAARTHYLRADAILRRLAVERPNHAGILDDLTWSHDRLWRSADLDIDPAGSLESVVERIDLAERLVELDPERLLSHYTLMYGHEKHAATLARMGDLTAAADAAAMAIVIGETLVARAPHIIHYRLALATVHVRMARIARDLGDAESGRSHLDRADDLSTQLLVNDPSHRQLIRLRRTVCQAAIAAFDRPEDQSRRTRYANELESLRTASIIGGN